MSHRHTAISGSASASDLFACRTKAVAASRLDGCMLWLLCLVLASSTAVLGYLQFARQTPAAPDPPDAAKTDSGGGPVPPAAAGTASSGDLALEAKGYIIPAHQILVSPKVGGMVVKLRIIESQRVA